MNIAHRHSGLSRRGALALTLSGLALAGVLSAAPSRADITPVSDVGVSLLAAQATVANGTTTITYRDEAEVIGGKATLLRAQYYNDGTAPQLSATMTIDTGSKLDPKFTLTDPACTATFGTTDVVTCRYRNIAPGQAEPFVFVAVKMTAPTVTSTATQVSVVDSAVPVPQAAPDGDDSAVAISRTGSQFAFLTDGESATMTSADGEITETFSVPAGATGGGGIFANLREDLTTQFCGASQCYAKMAVADFVQVGGTNNPPSKSNPLVIEVTYLKIKQTCAGLGGPSGCNPLFGQQSGSVAPPVMVPLCSTYAPNNGVPNASSDPCVFRLSKTNGIVTYGVAALKDLNLPIGNPT